MDVANAEGTKQLDEQVHERGGRRKSEQWSKAMHERLILPLSVASDSEDRGMKRHADLPVDTRRQDEGPNEAASNVGRMGKRSPGMRSRSLLQQEHKIYGPSTNQVAVKQRQPPSKQRVQRLDPLERLQRIVTHQETEIASNLKVSAARSLCTIIALVLTKTMLA